MSRTDVMGHLGGFLVGLPAGFLLMPQLQPRHRGLSSDEKSYVRFWRIIGLVTLIIWFVLGFVLSYTTRHPSPQ